MLVLAEFCPPHWEWFSNKSKCIQHTLTQSKSRQVVLRQAGGGSSKNEMPIEQKPEGAYRMSWATKACCTNNDLMSQSPDGISCSWPFLSLDASRFVLFFLRFPPPLFISPLLIPCHLISSGFIPSHLISPDAFSSLLCSFQPVSAHLISSLVSSRLFISALLSSSHPSHLLSGLPGSSRTVSALPMLSQLFSPPLTRSQVFPALLNFSLFTSGFRAPPQVFPALLGSS